MNPSFKKSTTTQEWMDMQKEYMEAWMQSQNNFMNSSMHNRYPFGYPQRDATNFFQQWQNGLFNGGMNNPSYAADMFRDQFTNSGKEFFDMMNRFNGQGSAMKNPTQIAMEWGTKMQQMLGEMMEGNGMPLTSFDPLNFVTSLPGIGSNREKQEMFNELYQRWSYFQQVSYLYFQGMGKIGMEANMAWSNYLVNPPEGEAPLETPRAIFNKWVQISEKVYSKYAISEDYMKLYGDTVNALSAFKSKLNEVVDSAMDEYGLPTRKELDSVHKYVTQLKRDSQAMKKEIKELKAALGSKSSTATRTVAASNNTASKKGK